MHWLRTSVAVFALSTSATPGSRRRSATFRILNRAGYWTAVAVRDTYAFVIGDLGYSSSVGLYVMDISDLAAPRFVGFAHTMVAAGIQIVGNRAYIGGGRNLVGSGYLTVFDVTDPLHPVDIGVYGTIGVVSVQQGLAYQASGGAGLRVVDVRALLTPVLNQLCQRCGCGFRPDGRLRLVNGRLQPACSRSG